MKTRKQKALMNTVVLAVYQLITFVCGLVLPRYILIYFGSTYNGITSSISQFLGFIVILQVGIAGSTRFALYKVLADKDNIGISGIVNATERYMQKVGFVLLVYIGILAYIYPYIATTVIPTVEVSLLVLILGASSFAQYFFGITYQILLVADQKQYIYYIIMSFATVINLVIAVVLMKIGQNIFIVKTGSAFIFILVPIILSSYVRKKYQINKLVKPNKIGLIGRWDVMWHSVANIVHNNTDLVVLTIFTDIKQVSVYTVYYLIINGIYKILSIFTNSLEAAFGNMFAKKEIRSVYKNLELYEFFICMFISIVFSCTLVLIVPFVKLYTNGIQDVNYIEPLFAIVAVVSQMVMCIRQPYLTVVQAAGHYKQTRNGAFIEAGLNLGISIVLVYRFGLIGVVVGTFVANVFRTLQYAIYLRNNIIMRPLRQSVFVMLWTGLNVGVIVLICQIVLNLYEINAWFLWIVCGGICSVIAVVFTVVSAFLFYRKKFMSIITIFYQMIKKREK